MNYCSKFDIFKEMGGSLETVAVEFNIITVFVFMSRKVCPTQLKLFADSLDNLCPSLVSEYRHPHPLQR